MAVKRKTTTSTGTRAVKKHTRNVDHDATNEGIQAPMDDFEDPIEDQDTDEDDMDASDYLDGQEDGTTDNHDDTEDHGEVDGNLLYMDVELPEGVSDEDDALNEFHSEAMIAVVDQAREAGYDVLSTSGRIVSSHVDNGTDDEGRQFITYELVLKK